MHVVCLSLADLSYAATTRSAMGMPFLFPLPPHETGPSYLVDGRHPHDSFVAIIVNPTPRPSPSTTETQLPPTRRLCCSSSPKQTRRRNSHEMAGPLSGKATRSQTLPVLTASVLPGWGGSILYTLQWQCEGRPPTVGSACLN